jgi:excisionase family DNA binding protein
MSKHLPKPPIERLAYSVPEAAAATGIGKSTLYVLMDEGHLPFVKVRSRRIIPAAALQRLITEGVPKPAARRQYR